MLEVEKEKAEKVSLSNFDKSRFQVYQNKNNEPNYQFGLVTSLNCPIESNVLYTIGIVFIRLVKPTSLEPFLEYLVYKDINGFYRFPSLETINPNISDLAGRVARSSNISSLSYNIFGLVGKCKNRFLVCECLDRSVLQIGTKITSDFLWITSGELIQDKILNNSFEDNVKQFVRTEPGFCRLYENGNIMMGVNIGYICVNEKNSEYSFNVDGSFSGYKSVRVFDGKFALCLAFFTDNVSYNDEISFVLHNKRLNKHARIYRVAFRESEDNDCITFKVEPSNYSENQASVHEFNVNYVKPKNLLFLSEHNISLGNHVKKLGLYEFLNRADEQFFYD